MKKIKIIPSSIVKLLGISCCSWMAWTSINVYSEQITIDSNIIQTFQSIDRSKKTSLEVVFSKDFIDFQAQDQNTATAQSTIVIQRPLTFDGSRKTIKPGTTDPQKTLFKIEMAERTDACIFKNIGSIEGDVNLAKGIFSVPAGTIKGIIANNGELVLVASNSQTVNQKVTGSGTIKIQAEGIIKLQTDEPIIGGVIFSGEGSESASLVVNTKTAPQEYLSAVREGDWIAFNQGFNGIYAGALSGRGSLAKMGEGALILTGDNKDRNALTRIFSGEISIKTPENLGLNGVISFKGGALHITDSLEMQNSLFGKVRLIIDEGKTVEISGLIGSDQIPETSFSVEGGGTVYLKCFNVYEGDTSVSSATLQLQSEENLGKGKLILKNARLKAALDQVKAEPDSHHLDLKKNIILNEAATIDVSNRTINIWGNISSSNSEQAQLIKDGPGKLTIHGNLYSSNLNIKEGFLQVSPSLGTKEEAVFKENETSQAIFNKIDGFKKDNLSLKESPMKSLNDVFVDSKATLTIDRNLVHIKNLSGDGKVILQADLGYIVIDSGQFSGSISNGFPSKETNPTIVKTSQKELKLSGDNPKLFTNLWIHQGVVNANCKTNTSVFVMKEGAFGGNASVKHLVNEGRVAPGNSIGILNIENDFIQHSSGRLEIEVSSQGKSDIVKVGNKASLAGQLRIIPEPGIYRKGTEYTILEAEEKVEGSFNNIENTALEIALFDVGYKPNKVMLSVTETMYQLPKDNKMSESSKKLINLIQNVQFKEGTDAFKMIENIFTIENPKHVEKAYSQMTPVQLGGMTHESYINACSVANSFTNILRRNDRCMNSISTIWVEPIGHYACQKNGYGLEKYKSYMGGVVIGGNHFAKENIVIGAGIGYTNSCLKWGKNAALSHIDSFYAGLNGGWVGDLFYVNASIITSTNAFKNKRYLNFAKVHHTIKSNHYGIGLTSRLEAGGNFVITQNISLRPFVDLDVYTIFERPINEKKSSLIHFHRGALTSHELRSKIALEATGNFVCNSICFSPGMLLGWITQTPIGKTDYKVSLNDTGKQLAVKEFQKHKINQLMAIGANVVASYKTTGISLYYEFDFGKGHSFIHRATASVDWKF